MNLLKSIFITSYMMLLMVVSGYAGWQLAHGANALAWVGVLMTSLPILTVITWLMALKSVARTSAHFPLPNLLGAIGVGIAMWASTGAGGDRLAPYTALAAWTGFWLYSYWFSTFGGRQPSARLRIGEPLPGFTLRDANDKLVTSVQLTDKPAILIFYRGNWCPLCMAQIKELSHRYRDLDKLGVRVALISPQPHENTVALARKFDVSFEFLTDVGNKAARTLGIENENGTPMGMQMFGYDSDTVLPTVVITDRAGKVVWTHQTDNYRVRPEPDTYFEVLREHRVIPAAS